MEFKEITLDTEKGEPRKFVLYKIPYLDGGREICTQFLPTAAPKVGDYQMNEALAKKMFGFIAVVVEGKEIRLATKELVHNHVTDFQLGMKLEKEMLEYNFGFFDPGKISAFLKSLSQKALQSILPILTELREQSSPKAAPPSSNSEQS